MNLMKHYNYSKTHEREPGIPGNHLVYIHFADGTVKVKETQLIYDQNSLIGETGGLLGLCLGLSVVSLHDWALVLYNKMIGMKNHGN